MKVIWNRVEQSEIERRPGSIITQSPSHESLLLPRLVQILEVAHTSLVRLKRLLARLGRRSPLVCTPHSVARHCSSKKLAAHNTVCMAASHTYMPHLSGPPYPQATAALPLTIRHRFGTWIRGVEVLANDEASMHCAAIRPVTVRYADWRVVVSGELVLYVCDSVFRMRREMCFSFGEMSVVVLWRSVHHKRRISTQSHSQNELYRSDHARIFLRQTAPQIKVE
ncbi:hypothetical protein K458DRAFT_182259 [Lentithecium fluviatile CBS 122367]|uniref:Uncharacterized protein n=1 Tax=Lentithecium fluviatile CBS 122367 TaxID=1168545 RepID=A0A6G1IDT9_9PLEO|nr:hypothetical protein K458DRAFT_182259 [Lentithecium fluviatile CBS 122367]